MSDEPTLKLYSLALAATRTADNQTAVGMQSALALLPEGASIDAAILQVAHDFSPKADGWIDHYATATEIPQGFPLEPYRLTWKIEKGR